MSKKKEMARNILRDNDIVKLYFNRVIPFYGYVMLILCWCYDFFLLYIRIGNIYDSDDLPLTQMVLYRTTGVNTEDEDGGDVEDNENYR